MILNGKIIKSYIKSEHIKYISTSRKDGYIKLQISILDMQTINFNENDTKTYNKGTI